MGGYSSGRTGGAPTAEACGSVVLRIDNIRRLLECRDATVQGWRMVWPDIDKAAFTLEIFRPEGGGDYLRFRHLPRDERETEIEYLVETALTRPHFGGERWWFRCPKTGRRAFKLFLPRGAPSFRSRAGWRLGYACQRETREDRAARRATKIVRRLGGDDIDWLPPKPRGMHHATYDRLASQWETANGTYAALWEDRIARFMAGWLPGRR